MTVKKKREFLVVYVLRILLVREKFSSFIDVVSDTAYSGKMKK